MGAIPVDSNNKRIAINTVFLYIRLCVMMVITLFSSRVLLQNLGISDYGVYNAVCGIVLFFSFINGTLTGGTQRYLNFSIGRGNKFYIFSIFRAALTNHAIIAALVFILVEIIGLSFIYTSINLPEGRFDQALWVFHASVLSLVLLLMTVPYQATIIAYERMNIYALMGIFDATLKLITAYILFVFPSDDRLIYYGIGLLTVSIIDFIVYKVLCEHKFDICRFRLLWKWSFNKELLTYSGWDSIAWMTGSASSSAINLLFNVFLGTLVNAAYGIAQQVSGLVSQLINSFQNAINPQIVKLYANNRNEELYRLMCNSCKFSCILVSFFAVPIFLRVEYFLGLWLGDYPELAPSFARIMIIQSLIIGFTRPIVNSVHATAKLKYPCIFSSLSLLAIIPVAALLLQSGLSPVFIMSICVIPWIIEGFVNMYFFKKYINVSIKSFGTVVLMRTNMTLVFLYVIVMQLNELIPSGFLGSVLLVFLSVIIGALLTLIIGVEPTLRIYIIQKMMSWKQ